MNKLRIIAAWLAACLLITGSAVCCQPERDTVQIAAAADYAENPDDKTYLNHAMKLRSANAQRNTRPMGLLLPTKKNS